MRPSLLLLGLTSLVLAAAAPSCKTATVIRATYTTNFACDAGRTLSHAVKFSLERTGNPPFFDGKDPGDATSCTPTSDRDALIGDLVLRPPIDNYDGTYDLVAIAGTAGGDTEIACNLEGGRPKNGTLGGQACVVSRRRVRFVDGAEIAQNVFLSRSCAGIVCAEGSSCNPLTSLCTALKENSTSVSGGSEGAPETDGGMAPDLDASINAKDTGPVDASVGPCNPSTVGSCNDATFAISLDVVEPYIVAGGRRVAWLSTGSGDAKITELDFNNGSRTIFTSTPFPVTTLPIRLGYVNLAARGLTLFALFHPAMQNQGPDVVAYQTAGWTALPGPSLTGIRIEGFASNNAALGGLYVTAQGSVPFIVDGTATKSEAAVSPATPSPAPMADNLFGSVTPAYHYANGQTVYEVTSPGKVNARVGVLPPLPAPARLLANVGPNEYIVSTNGRVGKTSPNGSALPGLQVLVGDGVLDAIADASYVYVLRRVETKPVTHEVLAISRSRTTVCTMPIADDLAAIAVDASCLYGARRTAGGYDLRVFPKATP